MDPILNDLYKASWPDIEQCWMPFMRFWVAWLQMMSKKLEQCGVGLHAIAIFFFQYFFFFTGREIYVSPLKGFYIVSILHEAAQYFIGIDLGKCLWCAEAYIIHQVSNSTETRILFFYQKYLHTKVEEQAASSICFLTWRDPAGPPKDTFCFPQDSASFEETPSEFLIWCRKNK